MSGTKFDPGQHLRNIKGKGGNAEYLDVKWRLVWLRSEHPDASTVIEHIELSAEIAIFRATVTIPGAGSATDYGSETPKDFGDYIEKAATKALGRALAQLGFGTQFVGEELDEGVRIVDSPVDRPQTARQRATPSPLLPPARPVVVPSDDGPPSPAPVIPYSAGEYTAILDNAWKWAEDGRTLTDIRNDLNKLRHRMTRDQRADTLTELGEIEAKYHAPAGVAG